MGNNKVRIQAAHFLSSSFIPCILHTGTGSLSPYPQIIIFFFFLPDYAVALNQNKKKHLGVCLASCGLVN